MSENFINITIPTYNRNELLLKVIPFLKKNTTISHKIVVVDNGSDKQTVDMLKSFHKEGIIDNLYLLEKNYGISCAVNIGWKIVPASLYMKLDSDMLVHKKDWISAILSLWKSGEDRSIIGPLWPSQIPERVSKTITTSQGSLHIACRTIPGCATIVTKETVAEIGYWSEDYGLYGEEDSDYCIRAHYSGHIMYGYDANEYITDLQQKEYTGLSQAQKKRLRDKNVGNEGRYGMYKLNEYLFSMYLRNPKVLLKHEILGVEGTTVHLRLSRKYVEYRNKLSMVLKEVNKHISADEKMRLMDPKVTEKFKSILAYRA